LGVLNFGPSNHGLIGLAQSVPPSSLASPEERCMQDILEIRARVLEVPTAESRNASQMVEGCLKTIGPARFLIGSEAAVEQVIGT
jgi:hypothetical protein